MLMHPQKFESNVPINLFLIYKQRLVPVQCVYDMCTLRGQKAYSIKWVS